MLRTQQEEFSSVIQHSGLDGLIDSLRSRAATIASQSSG
jgi:ABC-type transporter MlaC component